MSFTKNQLLTIGTFLALIGLILYLTVFNFPSLTTEQIKGLNTNEMDELQRRCLGKSHATCENLAAVIREREQNLAMERAARESAKAAMAPAYKALEDLERTMRVVNSWR